MIHAHRNRLSALLTAFAAGLTLLSCSVKENRRDCPTWLTLDVSRCESRAEVLSVRAFTPQAKLFSDTLRVAHYIDSLVFEKEIPREEVILTYWNGLYHNARWSGDILRVPAGMQVDSLYAGRDHLFMAPDQDEYKAFAHLEKQFMTLTIRFGDSGGLETITSFSCDYNAFSIKDFAPVKGNYSVMPEALGAGEYKVRIPRQGDDCSIQLSFSIQQSSYKDGYRLTLSEALRALSYDWNDPELKDATLTIASSSFVVQVQDWDNVYIGEVVYGGRYEDMIQE